MNELNIINLPVKNTNKKITNRLLLKPNWIKVRAPNSDSNNRIKEIKSILRKNNLYSVCEEAQCPNLFECFNNGIVTFMILGSICTRKCLYCAVKKGRPNPVDLSEPYSLANVIFKMKVNYVVLTSVARDDLHDGGSSHFSRCISSIRNKKNIKIEILVPDFKNARKKALSILGKSLPDVFNHNIETVPRLYKIARPGSSYESSLKLLMDFKKLYCNVPTKSGLMLGLGEEDHEIIKVMQDLYDHGVKIITLGQYLQPSALHLPVKKYLTLLEFKEIEKEALSIGFYSVFSNPFARSSYHAEQQNKNVLDIHSI